MRIAASKLFSFVFSFAVAFAMFFALTVSVPMFLLNHDRRADGRGGDDDGRLCDHDVLLVSASVAVSVFMRDLATLDHDRSHFFAMHDLRASLQSFDLFQLSRRSAVRMLMSHAYFFHALCDDARNELRL